MSLKRRKIKFKPRIKLNHNIYTETVFNTLHPAATSMFEEKLLCPYRYDEGKRLWRVVHSMHASMEEVYAFVPAYFFLRPSFNQN